MLFQKLYNNVKTEDDESSPTKCPKVTSLVLDRDPKTKETLVEVDPYICQHLKPHQVRRELVTVKFYALNAFKALV